TSTGPRSYAPAMRSGLPGRRDAVASLGPGCPAVHATSAPDLAIPGHLIAQPSPLRRVQHEVARDGHTDNEGGDDPERHADDHQNDGDGHAADDVWGGLRHRQSSPKFPGAPMDSQAPIFAPTRPSMLI